APCSSSSRAGSGRPDRSGGAIRGEKAMRVMLEWHPANPKNCSRPAPWRVRCHAFREIIPACSSSLILLWFHLKGHLMKDRHSNRAAILTGPSGHGFAITPDDATDLERPVRALYVGNAGNLAVTFASGVE